MVGYTSIVIGILFCKNEFEKYRKLKQNWSHISSPLGKKLPYFEQFKKKNHQHFQFEFYFEEYFQ